MNKLALGSALAATLATTVPLDSAEAGRRRNPRATTESQNREVDGIIGQFGGGFKLALGRLELGFAGEMETVAPDKDTGTLEASAALKMSRAFSLGVGLESIGHGGEHPTDTAIGPKVSLGAKATTLDAEVLFRLADHKGEDQPVQAFAVGLNYATDHADNDETPTIGAFVDGTYHDGHDAVCFGGKLGYEFWERTVALEGTAAACSVNSDDINAARLGAFLTINMNLDGADWNSED